MHASFRARPMAPSRGDSPTVGREGAPTANPSAAVLRLFADEDLTGRTVLDVGTGRGRLALALAPRSGRVVGIDRDEVALTDARRAAAAAGLTNVEFVGLDAEAAEYSGLESDAVVAHPCMSSPIPPPPAPPLTPRPP